MNKIFSGFLLVISICLACSSCASTAVIEGNFNANPRAIDHQLYEEVIVSGFNYSTLYQAERQTGSSEAFGYVTVYYEVIKKYAGGDVSMHIANMLKRNGIPAKAVKDLSYHQLKPGQVLLTGDVNFYNFGNFEPWKVIPFFIGLGNIFPAPWGFKTGSRVNYSSEVISSDGEILYQVPKNYGQAEFKHLWVWGSIVFAEKDFHKGTDLLGPQVFDEILRVFEAK